MRARNQYPRSGLVLGRRLRYRRLRIFLVLIVLGYLLYYYFPAPPKTRNYVVANRPPPEHELQAKPNFLYSSRLRQDPDFEYETKLEDALLRIERSAPPVGNGVVKKIWQIMLQGTTNRKDRSPDSILFEERNPDWLYTVSFRKK